MNRVEIHRLLSEYFPNSKDFVVIIFTDMVGTGRIRAKAERLRGRKFKVRIRNREAKEIIRRSGLTETEFYNALLECLAEEGEEYVKRGIEQWKKESILQFV